jgi:phage tail-like protein
MRSDPYLGSNFVIEIEGLVVGGFAECSGLSVETDPEEYREGGVNEYVHHFAAPVRYPPLVLRRGIAFSQDLWRWFEATTERRVERRNGTIFLLHSDRSTALAWDFTGAFPYKWSGPDFRADAANVAFETVELAHCGLSRSSRRWQ